MPVRSAASVLAILAAAVPSSGAAAQDSAPSDSPVQAIWKQQQIPFYFQSFTTFYSCDSLEAKVKRILVAVGANEDLKLRTKGCFAPHDIARLPYVEIDVVSAVEATPEALAERDKTRSTRELVARVRGESDEFARLDEQFPAQWRRVSLSRGKVLLDPNDCELLDQMKDKVFPKLGIRIVEDGVKCAVNQPTTFPPKLVVDALFRMPKPDEKQ